MENLANRKGFEKVVALPSGGVSFERHHFWRTLYCELDANGQIVKFENRFKIIYGVVLILLPAGILVLLAAIVMGIRSKDDLKYELGDHNAT